MHRLPRSCAALLCALAALVPSPVRAADGDAPPARMVLVLDSSGSMAEKVAGGSTRIAAAKDALRDVVRRLPDETQVGMRVFGATVENRGDKGACTDTQNVVPVGALDRSKLTAAITRYKPYGETPIGAALQGAAKDLGPATAGVPRTIVLLSDGEPTCAPDPCVVARQLRAQGIGLTINVVGLDVSGKARRILQCVAKAGGGRYVDAASADDLSAGLVRTSVRDVRQFRLFGEPVEGGTSIDSALALKPGRYTDTTLGKGQQRFYAIDKPKGGGVSISALIRPPKSDEAWHSVVYVRLQTPEGRSCGITLDQDFQILGQTPIVTSGLRYQDLGDTGPEKSQECADAKTLVASVEVGEAGVDYQLELKAYPEVEDPTTLPDPVDTSTKDWLRAIAVPATGSATQVAGGVNLADAPALEPGTTYADTIRPGELLVYKVSADWGQSPGLGVRMLPEAQADDALGVQGLSAEFDMVSALGQRMLPAYDSTRRVESRGFYNGAEPLSLSASTPAVRLRNLEVIDTSWKTVSEKGDYYFVVGLGRGSDAEEQRLEVPLRLRADLLGSVTGTPSYAVDAPQDQSEDKQAVAPKPEAAEDSGSGLWIPVGAGVLVALVVGGALLLRRRTRSG